ncbi:MAG: HEAT repeat domain-containing protein, partial [Phycisphaerae bacterium]|nr:HEAT repeat domain-containing protein [Phycisphaerae bacterium]
MTKYLLFVLSGVCLWLPAASAQQEVVRWLTSADQGLREAQKDDKPLMFYVLASKKDRDDDLEREQDRVMSDPEVLAQASHFVCVRLSRTRDREFLEKCGIEPTANMVAFFTSSTGEVLDRISAGGLTQRDSITQKLETVLVKHRKELLTRLEEVLEDTEAKTRDLTEALDKIEQNELRDADNALATFAQREDLNTSVRRKCYDVMATLQTDVCIRTLFEHSFSADEQISRAALSELGKCDPPAAKYLYDYLRHDHPDARLRAYEMIGKIADVRDLQPATFWETAAEAEQTSEYARLRQSADEAIAKW